MNFKSAVLAYIGHKGINKTIFADGLGMKESQLSKYMGGTQPGIKTINRVIAAYPDFEQFLNKKDRKPDYDEQLWEQQLIHNRLLEAKLDQVLMSCNKMIEDNKKIIEELLKKKTKP